MPVEIDNRGSLMTVAGSDQCLGYLMNFPGKGVYEPFYGKVEVSEEEANVHNNLLDRALLEGLDRNCEVGQKGSFYLTGDRVTTFMGKVVSDTIQRNGKSVTFYRAGKVYRGIESKNHDLFNFKRIR